MPGTPLPNTNSPEVLRITKEDPSYLSAYNVCLDCEENLAGKSNQRFVRILGYLLLHAPNQHVRTEVAKCVHAHKDSDDLSNVGEFFERGVIIPFKKHKGRTPKSSEHPSRPSFADVKKEMKDVTKAPKNHREAKDRALRRDKWRCTVTGALERAAPLEERDSTTTFAVRSRCAHIIPEFTLFRVEHESRGVSNVCGHGYSHVVGNANPDSSLDYYASILNVLKRFCYNIDMFHGEHVHSLTNIMTLEPNVHTAFEQLELYFEATSEQNRYEIRWFHLPHPNVRKFITLSTPDAENFPLPAPDLLALHATSCKVAHFSGAGEHIDKIYRDADEMDVLSADGSSADVLSYMLLRKPVMAIH